MNPRPYMGYWFVSRTRRRAWPRRVRHRPPQCIRRQTLPACRSRKTSSTAFWETLAEMHRASHLIALDWGTSSLRSERMNAQGDVLQTASTHDGILSVADRDFTRVFSRLVAARKSTRPNSFTNAHLVRRLLLDKKSNQ